MKFDIFEILKFQLHVPPFPVNPEQGFRTEEMNFSVEGLLIPDRFSFPFRDKKRSITAEKGKEKPKNIGRKMFLIL